jgi:hypothetical protein
MLADWDGATKTPTHLLNLIFGSAYKVFLIIPHRNLIQSGQHGMSSNWTGEKKGILGPMASTGRKVLWTIGKGKKWTNCSEILQDLGKHMTTKNTYHLGKIIALYSKMWEQRLLSAWLNIESFSVLVQM